MHPAAGGLSIYFLVYYLQHLFFELFGLACDAFRLADEFFRNAAVFEAGGVDFYVEHGAEYGRTPASDTELGLPWAAIAFTMSKTFTDAFIVRRGTCVA